MEILFLAANGYGTGASKLLRGLYERAVTLTYIAKYPEKAERFVRYAAIQEYKAMNLALQVSTEEEFDEVVGKRSTAAQVREAYKALKDDFQVTDCKKCNTKQQAFSWDIDMTSMVRNIGEPLSKYFLGSYTLPTWHIHATLASGLNDESIEIRQVQEADAGEFALVNATLIMLFVFLQQNDMFKLNLEDEIKRCDALMGDIEWKLRSARAGH
jgi:hypothetical protein